MTLLALEHGVLAMQFEGAVASVNKVHVIQFEARFGMAILARLSFELTAMRIVVAIGACCFQ